MTTLLQLSSFGTKCKFLSCKQSPALQVDADFVLVSKFSYQDKNLKIHASTQHGDVGHLFLTMIDLLHK